MREDRRLRRRELLARAGAAGLAALAADALPVVRAAARQLPLPLPPVPAVDPGGTLQAFADTMIPGRRVAVTESGAPVHPEAIAGVDPLPGAVETDALALYRHPKIGFGALAPAFLADLTARAGGRPFLTLPFDERVATCVAGLDFANPTRVLWEAAAAVPFAAFCAAALRVEQTAGHAAGYRVMGLPGTSDGYPPAVASYGRRLARERTATGSLP